MLLFFIIFVVIIFLIICIFFSKIVFHIHALEIHIEKEKITYRIDGRISLNIMKILPIISIKVNNARIDTILKRNKNINIHNIVNSNNKFSYLTILKRLKIQVYNINLKCIIDTEDVCITALLVGITSAIIFNLIHNYVVFNSKTDAIHIVPIYNMNNRVDIFLKCDVVMHVKYVLLTFFRVYKY